MELAHASSATSLSAQKKGWYGILWFCIFILRFNKNFAAAAIDAARTLRLYWARTVGKPLFSRLLQDNLLVDSKAGRGIRRREMIKQALVHASVDSRTAFRQKRGIGTRRSSLCECGLEDRLGGRQDPRFGSQPTPNHHRLPTRPTAPPARGRARPVPANRTV